MSAIEVGAEFGPSSWIEVPQEKIQAFADTTDDHNFIHVDPEMAAQTPFGGTVAHGYLTLSLLPAMSYEVIPHDDPGAGMALNYGLNKVRFPAPVPSGSSPNSPPRVTSVGRIPCEIVSFVITHFVTSRRDGSSNITSRSTRSRGSAPSACGS